MSDFMIELLNQLLEAERGQRSCLLPGSTTRRQNRRCYGMDGPELVHFLEDGLGLSLALWARLR